LTPQTIRATRPEAEKKVRTQMNKTVEEDKPAPAGTGRRVRAEMAGIVG
jgi:hypothetical protein